MDINEQDIIVEASEVVPFPETVMMTMQDSQDIDNHTFKGVMRIREGFLVAVINQGMVDTIIFVNFQIMDAVNGCQFRTVNERVTDMEVLLIAYNCVNSFIPWHDTISEDRFDSEIFSEKFRGLIFRTVVIRKTVYLEQNFIPARIVFAKPGYRSFTEVLQKFYRSVAEVLQMLRFCCISVSFLHSFCCFPVNRLPFILHKTFEI